MNIAQANTIPLPAILTAVGLSPDKEKPNDLYYLSPWRAEKTASFHVNKNKNVWYDHGESIGGDVVAFACTYLERSGQSYSAADGLQWLIRVMGDTPRFIPIVPASLLAVTQNASPLQLKKLGPIKHIALIRYLESRGVPLKIARLILQEAWLHNKDTGKNFFALAQANEDEGYELRNPFFKGCLRPKTITFIRGKDPQPESIHAFEGGMDYLSVIAQQDGQAAGR